MSSRGNPCTTSPSAVAPYQRHLRPPRRRTPAMPPPSLFSPSLLSYLRVGLTGDGEISYRRDKTVLTAMWGRDFAPCCVLVHQRTDRSASQGWQEPKRTRVVLLHVAPLSKRYFLFRSRPSPPRASAVTRSPLTTSPRFVSNSFRACCCQNKKSFRPFDTQGLITS